MVEEDLLIIDITMDTSNQKNPNITGLTKGLNTDFSPQVQPKESYRFALNAVDEAELGDTSFISNEEANEICATIPEGFTIIGKKFIGNGNTVLFLVNNGISEIGIFNENGNYETKVNDEFSTDKLNFNIEHQIDCVYRLRRGCERTLYFTDDYNVPRYYNIDKHYNFLKDGKIEASLFNLFHSYSKIPKFNSIEVIEQGQLVSGSYNVAIQYLDSDLNPTEWITVSDTIIIYNDSLSKPFGEIRGSTNAVNSYQDFGPTNKAIKLVLEDMDDEYPLYRLALIEASSGSGQVTKIRCTQPISTKNLTSTLDGSNLSETITEEEVATFRNSIETIGHLEQLDNMLLISKIKYKQVDWWKLQSYASKINTDLVLKEVKLDNVNASGNPKSPVQDVKGLMPGEIYSRGIVYVFEDGTTSPVFHIPGKHSSEAGIKYLVGENIRPLSVNNQCQTSKYTSLTDKCIGKDFWGSDSGNRRLENTSIRHHRVPTRGELGLSLVEGITTGKNYPIRIHVIGHVPEGSTNTVELLMEVDGTPVQSKLFFENEFAGQDINRYLDVATWDQQPNTVIITDIIHNINELSFTANVGEPTLDVSKVKSKIFGFIFSNIILPPGVVGYYIVGNERTEDNKTILDNGVLTPCTYNSDKDFVTHGLLTPSIANDTNNRIKKNVLGLINPEFKFNKKEYKDFNIIQNGYYKVERKNLTETLTQDVQNGTSYNPEINTGTQDKDGFSLHNLSRENELSYKSSLKTLDKEDIFYLNAASYKKTTLNNKDVNVYNVSCDNAIGILKISNQIYYTNIQKELPYVTLRRDLPNPYGNFRILPYYLSSSLQTGNTCEVFDGDAYITSMKYHSTMFYDTHFADFSKKKGLWKIVTGVLAAIGGIALVVTGNIPAGIMALSVGVSLAASGLETDKMIKLYNESYDEGVNLCVEDDDTIAEFGTHANPKTTTDDEIQWFSDTLSDIWIESSVNMSLRKGSTSSVTDFLNSPVVFAKSDINQYLLNKLTVVDTERSSGRLYKGFAGAELYEINEDYKRKNKSKVFFSLGLEYDCCSECNEDFPTRYAYSQQSFQEELTDNYRIFLPNNYRDLDGETGEITNLFKIQNSLFIHTKEALWNVPKNYQERVTGQIVSFLGTGSYFEIPAQKIVDDESGNSAGTSHKWGAIKTQHGYFFPCEKQNCFYRFNGEGLKPITDEGIKNEIYYKIPIQANIQNTNNPSNPNGAGFIAAYDSKKERVLFTKRDFVEISNVRYDKSWTLSYSLSSGSWKSWHSYLPNVYISTSQNVFSWVSGDNHIWKHNIFGKYQNFYGKKYPFIIEYVSVGSPLTSQIWDSISIVAEAKKWVESNNQFIDLKDVFFNKIIFYNTRQSSGILEVKVKDLNIGENYMIDQISSLPNIVIADRTERNWNINNIRDFRVNPNETMFKSDNVSVKNEYFIDKVVNPSSIDYNKDWMEMETFRDKFLVVRLIFDTFDDVKLLMNYSIENQVPSIR